MNRDVSIVQALHDSPLKAVVVLTGGGSLFLSRLLCVPGSSRTLLAAHIPYAVEALDSFCSGSVEQAVSRDSVKRLAQIAFEEAGPQGAGIACSAALRTDRDRHGNEHAWCCIRHGSVAIYAHIHFAKMESTRDQQEEALATLLLHMAAQAGGVPIDPWTEDSTRQRTNFESETLSCPMNAFYSGAHEWVIVHSDGRVEPRGLPAPSVLPGSFNPMHTGHFQLADAAEEITGAPVDFELSVTNADKPGIEPKEVRDRLRRIGRGRRILLTRAPFFSEKAELFPGRGFVIGYDTAARILDPAYYGGEQGYKDALRKLKEASTHFIVGGRWSSNGFRTVDELQIPQEWISMFLQIPESKFRCDVSSTQIRAIGRSP